MNLKTSILYQTKESKKAVMIFYLVVVLVIAFFAITIQLNEPSNFESTGGIEMSSMIFLFVVGLNAFKETFLMLMQNGVSRKTMFVSRIASFGILCTLMAIIDRIIVSILLPFSKQSSKINISGMYEQMYADRAAEVNAFQQNLEGILLPIFMYIASIAIGYFITVAYYRMSKPGKVAVSVGLPVSIFFIIPVVDTTITNGWINRNLVKAISFMFGFKYDNPYYAIISCIIGACLFFGLSWLLMRRAIDKN
ncbi:MAG TPA: hypothetical protein VJ888_02465 [Mobilitalea sp.]|nr:hypothetical protein [Mobilitalea sp.]